MTKQSNTIYYALVVLLLCCHVIKKNVILSLSKNLFFLMLIFIPFVAFSQELVNPSFEGTRGVAIQPYAWSSYGQASSPDTQPGAWRVTTPASHGNTYMSMVCRGYSIFDSYLWESCTQALNNPLSVGETYHYSIDLAHSKTFKADTIRFDTPAQLRIWGMSANGQKELLWESGAVANTDWKTFYFELNPNIPTDFLILEAYYTEMPKYCGNILVDNMQYYPEAPVVKEDVILSLSKEDTTEITNNINQFPDTIPTQIDGREVNTTGEFTFRGDQLTITVWDNRTTDGDIISLFLNSQNILKEFTISKDRLDVTVDVEEGKAYYLTLYAHNLGDIPPNTVALYISDGQRKKFITLTSDLKACGAVELKIEQSLAELKN